MELICIFNDFFNDRISSTVRSHQNVLDLDINLMIRYSSIYMWEETNEVHQSYYLYSDQLYLLKIQGKSVHFM